MNKIIKNAYAKINLTLEILDKRPDGYHNIRSVMQKVSLCDILTFSFNSTGNIFLSCSKDVCAMTDNLAYKAATAFLEKYKEKSGQTFGADIHIEKVIPDKAGLAGGSADCACVLDAFYEKFGVLEYSDVEEIAASLGSDINFCLDKYRCGICTDRGIAIEKCKPFDCANILVCVPETGLKTSEIYRAFDAAPILFDSNPTEKVSGLLNAGKSEEIYPYICNSFEPICEKYCTDISMIKNEMNLSGAVSCAMSGSGSSVFGIFDDFSKLLECKQKLQKMFDKCFACSTVTE